MPLRINEAQVIFPTKKHIREVYKEGVMRKTIIALIIFAFALSFVGCATTSNHANSTESTTTETVKTKTDEETAIEYFGTLVEAVKADTSGVYAEIKLGTDAHTSIVEIEKIYKRNTTNKTITELYYYCEVVSCVYVYGIMEMQSYLDKAEVYAKQIDLSYTGPYAADIIELAKKYGGDSSGLNTKNALTMSDDEKADVKWWIEQRYDYYDRVAGKYSGEKYTDIIFEEAAFAYGITVTDVYMVWQKYEIKAKQSSTNYRKANTDPNGAIVINTSDTTSTDYKNIRVGVSPDWEPFEYINASGELDGFEVALAKAFAEYNEANISFVQVASFDDLLTGLNNGSYDIAMSGLDLTDERSATYGHSNVYFQYDLGGYTMNVVAYTRKSDDKLIGMINEAIIAVKSSSEYIGLKEHYGVEALNGRFSD